MDWDLRVSAKFKLIIERIPVFHRHITQEAVTRRAEELANKRSSKLIEEVDVIGAFFTDVPSPFYSMMIRLLEQTDFDYKKYGFPKKNS